MRGRDKRPLVGFEGESPLIGRLDNQTDDVDDDDDVVVEEGHQLLCANEWLNQEMRGRGRGRKEKRALSLGSGKQ